MNPIDLKLITTLEEMEGLRPQWNRLLAAAFNPTVFDTWEWQYLAAKILVEDQHPVILTAYEGNELVAILPLRRRRTKIGHLIPVTVWATLGGGLTDYNTLLVRADCVTAVKPVLTDYLKRCGRPIDLTNVLPDSTLHFVGKSLLERDFRAAVYESKIALLTGLEADYTAFSKGLKKKFRKTLHDNQNYMDRVGGYTYHQEPASDELLETLVTLHTSRWRHKGEGGALARQQTREFHSALSRIQNPPFDIQYFTIRREGKIVAILYGFAMNRRFYAYLSGFDMAHARISPGNMIFNFCIRHSVENGIETFDMLRGDMKYKQTWATASFDMKDALYFPPGLYGRGLYLVMKIVQGIKRRLPPSLKNNLKKLTGRKMPETSVDD